MVTATIVPDKGEDQTLALEAGSTASVVFGVAKSDWKIHAFDSEQKGVEEARFSIDEDPDTIWHSRWSPDSPPHPHFVAVDMGAARKLTGFTYLPRSGIPNGTVVDYAFQVSADGEDWRTVAEGSFPNMRNNPGQQVVRFGEATGSVRFFRFEARSEVNGRPWASAAELGVLAK